MLDLLLIGGAGIGCVYEMIVTLNRARKELKEAEIVETESIKVYKYIPIDDYFQIKKEGNVLKYKYIEGEKQGIRVCIGVDENEEYVWIDFLENYHLLVAGASGYGKTNILNVIMAGLMKSYTESELKIMLCDYKRADVYMFRKCRNVIGKQCSTNDEELMKQLVWLEKEALKRSKIIEESGSRSFSQFNKTSDDKMSCILFVIDELAQIQGNKKIKDKLHKVTSLVRSYGIFIIGASQEISKETLGKFKVNITQIIGFKTKDNVDGNMIIKGGGLEDITNKGECKYERSGNVSTVKTFYINDEMLDKILVELQE